MTRLTIAVCKIIAKRLIKSNWYHGLVSKWKKTVKEKKDVQLKCITNRRATHGYRGNEYVMEGKTIRKKKKREKNKRRIRDRENEDRKRSGQKRIMNNSKEQILLYLTKKYYVD